MPRVRVTRFMFHGSQIDILRRHKNDYETGDLRYVDLQCAIHCKTHCKYSGEEFAESPAIHASRSDADLHKAWRGRARPSRRQGDAAPDVVYAQQTGSHPAVYPNHAPHWSREYLGAFR